MSTVDEVRRPPPVPLAEAAQWFVRHLCTANPFYVISAGLFLAGLYATFPVKDSEIDTWALLSGLAGYTLLLAGTAFLLVRFAKAWDDLRTVLLLVVLMFLATSVTFDELIVLEPGRGAACSLIGLAFAILVSEMLMRGIGLRMPAGFRLPYHLILGLFFVYPLVVGGLADANVGIGHRHLGGQRESLVWALYLFGAIAGLASLTLLPAIRRGPSYVAENGSPWSWPLYPWVLFGLFALAVPARSYLLCYSMHPMDLGDRASLVFGAYFVIPFGLAVAVLLLEIGVVSGLAIVQRIALATPIVLTGLAMVGHSSDRVYQEFLDTFIARLGGTPLFWTLVATLGFYGVAALRQIRLATGHLTAALIALACVAPDTLGLGSLVSPSPAPLIAVAGLQVGLGILRRSAWHSVFGGIALAAGISITLPGGFLMPLRGVVFVHLGLLAVFVVGAAFRDDAGHCLRDVGAALALIAGVVVTLAVTVAPAAPWWIIAYPPAVAGLLAAYGWLTRHHRPSYVCAGLIVLFWGATAGWRLYALLRQHIVGLDQMVLGLAAFVLAVLISLGKAGHLRRWLAARGWVSPPPTAAAPPS
jgi:hypothetical protein